MVALLPIVSHIWDNESTSLWSKYIRSAEVPTSRDLNLWETREPREFLLVKWRSENPLLWQ